MCLSFFLSVLCSFFPSFVRSFFCYFFVYFFISFFLSYLLPQLGAPLIRFFPLLTRLQLLLVLLQNHVSILNFVDPFFVDPYLFFVRAYLSLTPLPQSPPSS